MAKCKHCGEEVSPTARFCPKCGDKYTAYGSGIILGFMDKKKKRRTVAFFNM